MIYSLTSEKRWQLIRVAIECGSPEYLLEKPVVFGRYSPDGKQIGLLIDEGNPSDPRQELAVLDLQSRSVTRTFPISPSQGTIPDNAQWVLRWTPDGKALTFALRQGSTTNLWIQPVSGGPQRQITHFPDDVFAYAWSPDGKRLAVTREVTSSDVVLFRNFH